MKKQQSQVLSDLVSKRYRLALNYQRPLFTKFNEYYQLYRGILDDRKQNYVGRAKLFVPKCFTIVETILPRLIGQKPKAEAIPREVNDIPNAQMVTNLINYQWDTLDMRRKVKDWVKQALIYGVGICKLTWEFDGEKDSPRADIIDLFDFFIDPDATTVEDAAYVIHRTERPLWMIEKNPNYKIPAKLYTEVQRDEYKTQRDAIFGMAKQEDKDKQMVEILEYWGKADVNGDGEEEDALIVIANGNHVLRATENPYEHTKKPFIALFDTQIPQTFWAIGEIEPIKYLQYELNDTRNQRMDNVTLILNRMWKINKNAGVDEEDLVSQAGQVIHCDDMNGVEPLVTPDVTASAYNEETIIKGDIQETSGVNDYVTGGSGQSIKGQEVIGNDTATGIALLQEAGNARFRYKLDNLEDALREFGKQLIALDQQYMDQAMVIRIVGEEGVEWLTVAPEDIVGEFDVSVEAGSTQPMNKSIRRAQARQLLSTVLPLLGTPAGGNINLQYFIKYLLNSYDLTKTDEAFSEGGSFGFEQAIPGGLGQAGQPATEPGMANPNVASGGNEMVSAETAGE